MKFFAVVRVTPELKISNNPQYIVTYPDDKENTKRYADFWSKTFGIPNEEPPIYSCYIPEDDFEKLKGNGTFCYTETVNSLVIENNKHNF